MNSKLLSAAALALAALAFAPDAKADGCTGHGEAANSTQEATARKRGLTRGRVNQRLGKQLRQTDDTEATEDGGRRKKKAKKKKGKQRKKKKARRRGGVPPVPTPDGN